MDDPLALIQIKERFDFEPPKDYLALSAQGLLHPQHEQYIQFTDMLWLSGKQIAEWEFDPHFIEGLIPFAQTLSGHLWAWHPLIDLDYRQAVVFCPDEDEVAVLYAPDFQSALYRLMLDECANTFLVERSNLQQAQATLKQYVETCAGTLRESWTERLRDLVQRPLQATQENFYGVLSEDEVENILAEDIAYERLDEEFLCVKEEH